MDKWIVLTAVLAITGFIGYSLVFRTRDFLIFVVICYVLWKLHKYGFID